MISYKYRVISETFDSDKAWIKAHSSIVESAAAASYEKNHSGMLQELGAYPPKRSGYMRWASKAQRIAVMAKLRKEGNLPYRRSYRLRLSWVSELIKKGFESIISITNQSPYSKWVGGDFGRGFTKPQQPFHKDTGWKLFEHIRVKWFTLMRDEIVESVSVKIEDTRVRFRKQRKDAKR